MVDKSGTVCIKHRDHKKKQKMNYLAILGMIFAVLLFVL